jgi:hypothetical protein
MARVCRDMQSSFLLTSEALGTMAATILLMPIASTLHRKGPIPYHA